jgi:thiamine-phosphate pyrophosphorylase
VIGSRDAAEVAACAIRGGADAIQLREKASPDARMQEDARRILPLTRSAGIPLIINDRVSVALAVDADGLHVGQDDLPPAEARRLIGPHRLLGRSTHSLTQALAAQDEGVDYVGFGPVFPTPTKPEYGCVGVEAVQEVVARLHVPVVCIGGMDRATIGSIRSAGAACVAVVRAVCAAKDPKAAARELKCLLTEFHRAPHPSAL